MSFLGLFDDVLRSVTLFVVLWVCVCGLLALLSGWPTLARVYPASNRPSGLRLDGQVFRVGLVPERNITSLVVAEAGLYLWTNWAFRVLRPAMCIPWSAITSLRAQTFLWETRYTIETESRIPIVVSKKAYEAIHPHVSGRAELA
jgi:hypothetical protein